MSALYQALYRKWRPRSFEDVISQPHVTIALQNQLREQKTAHAYLFTGSRGTGKTTCARILAKAVNCQHPQADGNPCLACENCLDAERGVLNDIVEIDAASNNSVENIRDLREGTVYLPERCRYKVYIIDEVHMLSSSAWGALLKVMEEPPEYVKFILATTEVHKVPATIISRCQRYDFHRIRTADIAVRLTEIAKAEQFSLTPEAAQLIAHLSDGGMRDALSLLDQCASVGEEITASSVTQTAGVAGRDSVFTIIEAIQSKDGARALAETGTLYDQSKDMVRLCDELLEQLRNMMLLKVQMGQAELLTCLPDEVPKLQELSSKSTLNDILSQISTLQDCREQMQHGIGKRVELEMTLLQLTMPNYITQPVPQLTPSQSPPQPNDTAGAAPTADGEKTKPLRASDFTPVQNWLEILEAYQKVNPGVSGSLAESSAFTAGNTMLIVAKNRFFLTLLKNKENALSLRETVKQFLGVDYNIRAKCSEPEQSSGSKAQSLVEKAQAMHLDTEVE
ncbi:MAG: DNA polymerase III subunit gamma/tau [Ruminococcus sp.]|nr:DNA polymerase III subunit gamma/tau [Ruminococcus sp.]